MKKAVVLFSIIALSISFNSCRLFKGGGGGGHCPAYGTSIEKSGLLENDINNETELRETLSGRM